MAEQRSQHIGFTQRRADALLKKSGLSPAFHPPNKLTFDIQSLPFDWIDLNGQRQLVAHLVKFLDFTAFFWPLPSKDPDEEVTFYLLNYDLSVSPSLYDDSKKHPLVLSNIVNYVRRTSRCYQVELKQKHQIKPMLVARYLEINIDSETRKPSPFPQWWKEQNKFPNDGDKPQVEDVIRPCSGILSTERKLHFTDIDENDHTNFSVYIKLCLDTFYENIVNGKYTNNSPTLLNGWIKTMKIQYKSDSALGDILAIDSWEDSKQTNTYHFELRKDTDVAVVVSLSFYTSFIKSNV